MKVRHAQNLQKASTGLRVDDKRLNARARVELSLGHQPVPMESYLASSDTLISSTCKDDGTQNLKLKI